MDTVGQKLDLQGHRGARGLRPESTLPAFEVALDLQVTTLEFDLHLTRDGALVVWHDPYISAEKCRLDPTRGDGIPDPDGMAADDPRLMIANLTMEELRSYICDRNPDPDRFPHQSPIPTALAGLDYGPKSMGEVLDFVDHYAASGLKTDAQRAAASGVRFNVETKRVFEHPEYIGDDFDGVAPGAFEEAVVALVGARGIESRFTLQSFDHRSLWAARLLAPEMTLAALTDDAPDLDLLAHWAQQGASIWSPNYKTLTAELMAAAGDAGLQVIPWTINDEQAMHATIAQGVDGLISDRPDLMMRLVR